MISPEDVALRLGYMGCNVSDEDMGTIECCINSTEEYILNYCNIRHIPIELYNTAVDMCCGNFLNIKNSLMELDGFDPTGALSSITEGDVSISYTNGISKAVLFEELINRLCNKDSQLIAFRRLKW